LLCCICKEKEATVHLTQIQGDKVQKVDLCEECAKTKGVNDPTGFSLAGLLKPMHKGTRHVGKVPEALRQSRDMSDRLKLLQKKLSKAIEGEDFEEAAILRDEI